MVVFGGNLKIFIHSIGGWLAPFGTRIIQGSFLCRYWLSMLLASVYLVVRIMDLILLGFEAVVESAPLASGRDHNRTFTFPIWEQSLIPQTFK